MSNSGHDALFPPIGPLLKLSNVSRIFGQTEVLKSTDLTVFPGDFIAIVGPSGSGKSTLLNIIGLLDEQSTGQYFIKGIDSSTLKSSDKDRLRSGMFGFVFQNSNLLSNETAANNASLGLQIQGQAKSLQINRVSSLLESFGLSHRSQTKAKLLSGGERQRLALARAVATAPTVLLADEPTGNLDTSNSKVVIEDLIALNNAGTTIIVITHDKSVADSAKKIITIDDGHVIDTHNILLRSSLAEKYAQSEEIEEISVSFRQKFFRAIYTVCSSMSSLTNRPLTAALLVFAFVLGTGGLTASIGLSQSAAAQVSERLTNAALDEVVITIPPELEKDLGKEEIYARTIGLQGVVDAGIKIDVPKKDSPVSRFAPNTVGNSTDFTGSVFGANSTLFDVFEAQVLPNSSSRLLDLPQYERSAILGDLAAESLDITSAGPGVKIWVGGESLDVIGLIKDPGRQPEIANSIFISDSFASALPRATSSWVVRTLPGYPAPVSEALPIAISPGNAAAVGTQTVADLRSLRMGVSNDLGTFVGLVSIVLLVLASLSAGTSMYLSVYARREEIAMRRAIGQSRSSIRALFIIEGLIVGLFGGAAGAAIGTVVLVLICSVQKWTPALSASAIWVALVFGALTGIISAFYPAFVAARMNPAQGLRG